MYFNKAWQLFSPKFNEKLEKWLKPSHISGAEREHSSGLGILHVKMVYLCDHCNLLKVFFGFGIFDKKYLAILNV
jgi:hypothetical protein